MLQMSNTFYSIANAFSNLWNYLTTTTVSSAIRLNTSSTFLNELLGKIADLISGITIGGNSLGDTNLLTFFLVSGLTFFVAFSLIKYLISAISS